MLLSCNVRIDAFQRTIVRVYEAPVRTPGLLRGVYEQLAELAVGEVLPLVRSSVAVRVLLGADQRPFVMKLTTVGDAIAPRRDVDAHLVAVLRDPGVFEAIRFARRSEPLEVAIGAVVFPPVDDAVAVAVGFDTDGAAVLEIGAHVNLVVVID